MTVSTSRVLDCLEAGYRLDLDDDAYVRNLVDHIAPLLDRGLGILAYTYRSRGPRDATIDRFATSPGFDAKWLRPYYAAIEAAGHAGPPYPTGFRSWSHLPCGQASLVRGMKPFLPLFAHLGGSRDTLALNALDASGHGLWLGAPMPSRTPEAAATVAVFTRIAAHLTTALRLRRNAPEAKPNASAVLAPNGKLLHAEDEADVTPFREDLRRATLAFDHARTKGRSPEATEATRKWKPLVSSRWSLLDEFDSDGRRFVVAVENAPPTRARRTTLSCREHQVMTQAHLGHSAKVIAYELGLSASTVRVLLHRATKKLGSATTREALVRFDELAQASEDDGADDTTPDKS